MYTNMLDDSFNQIFKYLIIINSMKHIKDNHMPDDRIFNGKYKFFDKTADAKFQAFGSSLDEAFQNAAEAMVSIMYNLDSVIEFSGDEPDREIIVDGTNLESLLYNFLEELILIKSEDFSIKEMEFVSALRAFLHCDYENCIKYIKDKFNFECKNDSDFSMKYRFLNFNIT